MLAVTAGDGACGENSTQPTARISTLTALVKSSAYAIPTILVTAYPDDDVHQQTKLLLAARKWPPQLRHPPLT